LSRNTFSNVLASRTAALADNEDSIAATNPKVAIILMKLGTRSRGPKGSRSD
jgi:hypothetical protein